MSVTRREWTLLSLTLVGAGLGQWVWLTNKGPFILGLAFYVVALMSWLNLTQDFPKRPTLDRPLLLALAGGTLFGILALLAGLQGPQNTLLALSLAAIALGYFAWAANRSRVLRTLRQRLGHRWIAVRSENRFAQIVGIVHNEAGEWVKAQPARTVLFAGSIGIVGASGLAAHRGKQPSAHLVSLAAWGLGLLLFVISLLPANFPQRLYRWLQVLITKHRMETLFVVGLAILAIVLRTIDLNQIPPILTGDEGAMGLEAVKVLKGEQVNPFSTGWTNHPTLYFYNLALFLRLLGQSIAGLRMASALVGAFTIPVIYLLARRSFNRTVAGISALFLAGYHLHIHYSRLALNNVWAPFFAALTLFLLWEGLQTRQSWRCALGGIAMGLGQYTYFGARLLPLLVVAWLLYLGLVAQSRPTANDVHDPASRRPSLTQNGLRLVVFWLAFLLAVLPLNWFFLEHWNAFSARVAQVGVFGSTGVNPGQEGYFAPLASGLFKSVMAFNYVRDRSIFYGPPLPLLHWLSGIAFFFGVVQTVLRWREPGYGLVLIWLLGTIIFGGVLMNHPPESPRLLFAAPAAAVLVAVGLIELAAQIATLLRQTFGRHRFRIVTDGQWLAFSVALVATGISAFYYFGIYTPSDQFGDIKTRVAHHVGIWARELEPNHPVFFFGAPYMTYRGFPSMSFLAPRASIQDVIEPIKSPLPVKSTSTFIFIPQRLGELGIMSTSYPNGRQWKMLDHEGRLLFVAYEVDPET